MKAKKTHTPKREQAAKPNTGKHRAPTAEESAAIAAPLMGGTDGDAERAAYVKELAILLGQDGVPHPKKPVMTVDEAMANMLPGVGPADRAERFRRYLAAQLHKSKAELTESEIAKQRNRTVNTSLYWSLAARYTNWWKEEKSSQRRAAGRMGARTKAERKAESLRKKPKGKRPPPVKPST